MGTDVAIRTDQAPAHVHLSADQLRYIAQTEFVPKSMRGKLPAILACVAYGRELGLGDMVALNTIHVIDGRTSLSAEAMVSLVRQRGHSIQGNFSGDSCTVTGRRADNGDEITVTWTKEMAKDAGLLAKDNWKKYGSSMLWARAVSQLCRMLFADCFAGNTYTPGEVPSDAEGFAIDDEDVAGEPKADATPAADPDASSVSAASARTDEQPSPAMLKKLNVLVGTLRDGGHITTEQVYAATGRNEVVTDDDGRVRWSPLRDSLTRDEAHNLIDRLERYADNLATA